MSTITWRKSQSLDEENKETMKDQNKENAEGDKEEEEH